LDLIVNHPTSGWVDLRPRVPGEVFSLATINEVSRVPGITAHERGVRLPTNALALRLVRDAIPEAPALRAADKPSSPAPAHLLPHQHEAHAHFAAVNGVLADAPGLGKTRTALAIALDCPGAILIVGPKFTRAVWERELREVYGERLAYFEGRDASAPIDWDEARVWFIHFDVLDAWQGRIYSRFAFAIVDEAHYARDAKSRRGRATAAVVGTVPRRLLLTGTPLVNKPAELWHLLTLATGPGTWGALLDFRRRYCGAMHDGYGWRDGDASNLGELHARMGAYYLRRTEHDLAVPMPGFTRTTVAASLGEQAQAYHAALAGVDVAALVEAVVRGYASRDVLGQLGRIRKLTSRAKLAATADYVAALLDGGESVVVFTHERETARLLASKVDAQQVRSGFAASPTPTPLVLTGDLDEGARTEGVAKFQREATQRPMLLAATYGALGVGVTLTAARHVVLHDLDWTFAAILQAEKRVHRLSQTRPVTSAWVLAEDSIDTVIARVLLRKASYLAQTLGQTEGLDAVEEVDLRTVAGRTAESFDDEVRAWLDEARGLV
jgi:SWI/SNF-related matrix-associated actin-dependent regulator 1 of chromatin subfamily A